MLGLKLSFSPCFLTPSVRQGDSWKHQQQPQPALGMASASHHLLVEATQKKSTPGTLWASRKLSLCLHNKVDHCLNRTVALERAGGLLSQAPPGQGWCRAGGEEVNTKCRTQATQLPTLPPLPPLPTLPTLPYASCPSPAQVSSS